MPSGDGSRHESRQQAGLWVRLVAFGLVERRIEAAHRQPRLGVGAVERDPGRARPLPRTRRTRLC
jgi:hypothetical protein